MLKPKLITIWKNAYLKGKLYLITAIKLHFGFILLIFITRILKMFQMRIVGGPHLIQVEIKIRTGILSSLTSFAYILNNLCILVDSSHTYQLATKSPQKRGQLELPFSVGFSINGCPKIQYWILSVCLGWILYQHQVNWRPQPTSTYIRICFIEFSVSVLPIGQIVIVPAFLLVKIIKTEIPNVNIPIVPSH